MTKDTTGWGVLGAGEIARKFASDLKQVRARVPGGGRGAWPLVNAMYLAVIVPWAAALLANGAGTPAFVTSEPNGGWFSGGYYVHNNMWNRAKYNPCTSTLSAWSPDNWQVVTRMNNQTGDGAVKTYPNVHRDYDRVPIDSFDALTSHFAATGPHVGIYNVAYDIWINGIAKPGCTEIMIWTENFNQVPGGKCMQEVTFGSHTYKAYRNLASGYLAFVTTTNFTSGTVNLLDIMKWSTAQGWLPEKSTLNQICFGIEMVSTDDTDATFRVTAFSIDSRAGAGANPTRLEPRQAVRRRSGADTGATSVIRPSAVTVDPASGTIPTGYLVWNVIVGAGTSAKVGFHGAATTAQRARAAQAVSDLPTQGATRALNDKLVVQSAAGKLSEAWGSGLSIPSLLQDLVEAGCEAGRLQVRECRRVSAAGH